MARRSASPKAIKSVRTRSTIPNVTEQSGLPSRPVKVSAGELRRLTSGHAWRDGSDVRISTTRDYLIVDADEVRKVRSRVEIVEQGNDIDELVLLAFNDDAKRRHHIGIATRHWEEFGAMMRGEAPARRRLPWRAAVSGPILIILLLCAIGGVGVQGLWWGGNDVTAEVAALDEPEEPDFYMDVAWIKDGKERLDEVGYSGPAPQIGDTAVVRSLAPPFDGVVWGDDGFYEFLSVTSLVIPLIALVWLVISFVRRLRRPRVRVHAPPDALRDPAAPADEAGLNPRPESMFRVPREDVSTVDLIRAVGRRNGLESEPVTHPQSESTWAQITTAWTGYLWFLALPFAMVPSLFEWPMPVVWAGLAITAFCVAYIAVTTIRIFVLRRRPYRAAWSSEWSFVSLNTGPSDYLVFLVLGPSVFWSTHVSDGFPGLTGRCCVRGELVDGGAIHLRIGDDVWTPDAPVEKLSGEDVADLRAELFTDLASLDPFRL